MWAAEVVTVLNSAFPLYRLTTQILDPLTFSFILMMLILDLNSDQYGRNLRSSPSAVYYSARDNSFLAWIPCDK
jgi:hypothetical protein